MLIGLSSSNAISGEIKTLKDSTGTEFIMFTHNQVNKIIKDLKYLELSKEEICLLNEELNIYYELTSELEIIKDSLISQVKDLENSNIIKSEQISLLKQVSEEHEIDKDKLMKTIKKKDKKIKRRNYVIGVTFGSAVIEFGLLYFLLK